MANQALMFRQDGLTLRRAVINGATGIVSLRHAKPLPIGAFAVRAGKIVEVDS